MGAVDTHPRFLFILSVILGHLQIYFSILASCLFSASNTCEAETTKQQEREEEICSVFHTSSQDDRCVEGGIQGVCVWACLSVSLPVRKGTSLATRPMCTRSDVVSDGHSVSLPVLIFPPSLLSPVISDSCRSYKSSISIAPSVKMGQSWGAAQH